MREILFRGKRVDNGEWVEGSYIEHEHAIEWVENVSDDGLTIFSEGANVIPETVGQYTGLTDKNGKKIFEGYIIKCYRYANGKDGKLVFENLVVVWDDMDACFALAEVGAGHISYWYNDYQMDDTHEFEVIGNIHDNPELLE